MVQYNSYEFKDTYVDDFGDTARIVTFRRSTLADDTVGAVGSADTAALVEENACGGGQNLFEPRYLEVVTVTGGSYKFVIPNRDTVETDAQQFLANDVVACVNYVGERWTVVPSGKVGNYNSDAAFAIDPSAEKDTGAFQYQSDIGAIGFVQRPFSIMSFPSEFAGVAKSCLVDPKENAVCTTSVSGIYERRFIVIANAQTGTGEATGKITSRAAKVGGGTNVAVQGCGSTLASDAVCLRYFGERITNLGRFLSV